MREILNESRQVLQQILAVIGELPDEVQIERIEPAYYFVWVGDKRFQPGKFFDHFHDDHEAEMRAWLARVEKQCDSLADAQAAHAKQLDELYAEIGRLTTHVNFLKQRLPS